jgi:single-strand selective monofunctional uracil DNA glycosylase
MPDALVSIARDLSRELSALKFAPPVTHVYDPLTYAWAPYEAFVRRFGGEKGRTLLVGMNPGPFGMAQTGVPFGEVKAVRDWMGISGAVGRPDPEHPKRKVLGFEHPRAEVSGTRLWGWAEQRYGTADAFFSRFYVANWCPLCFLEESGRNRTPDKLAAAERDALYEICDRALRRQVEELEPAHVVGVGAFAEQRAREALEGLEVPIGRILHPSPANPAANAGWAKLAEAELEAMGVRL